ncbi:hypothetical protein IFM89_036042 [Coptis chinensis]|uniref:Agenet domain-containing protein n=1 Tax=Coptis chinensis TaxID=261450 RepID=A0A835HAP7_9MAGN|nr:hypothetical protein IFM89_036042 [Coptis chinensis]
MRFKRGQSVEIALKEEGFQGSYYAGIVLTRLQDNDYIVEYKTLVNDEETRLLRDVINGVDIRPVPPEIKVSSFGLCEKADAYDNDGWWSGTVTGRKGVMYNVYFEGCREEIAYPLFRLRLHQEWKGGKWVVGDSEMV